jgi:hypothetical protein
MDTRIHPPEDGPRRFDFTRDSFAFENETFWEYHFDVAAGNTSFSRREPKPSYAHRCFVLTRAARQFFFHARFDKTQKPDDDHDCCRRIRAVMTRNVRAPAEPGKEIVIPGYVDLREFSRAREPLLKAECGGAWRSYVLRSHWRMVFPISRAHQARTAASLDSALKRNMPPIIHLVKFPSLTINHSMMLFATAETGPGLEFQAYDPNNPAQTVRLSFDHETKTFHLPPNRYWAGGEVDIIEIYRNWLM